MPSWSAKLGVELSPVSYREKIISAIGGCISVALLILICETTLGGPDAKILIASMGASAVLLFGVPHGQLSQPWPVIVGHVLSALIGVLCAKGIAYPPLAAALAVGLSIAAMHQFKCIHPPGGATAFTAVMGGEAIHQMGFEFIFIPVLLNATLMVVFAILLNGLFPWRRYPAFLSQHHTHSPQGASSIEAPTHEEIVEALRSLDSFVDITEEDLIELYQILTRLSATHHQPLLNLTRTSRQ